MGVSTSYIMKYIIEIGFKNVKFKMYENCGQKSMNKRYYFKDKSPDKFYVKYVKGQNSWKN